MGKTSKKTKSKKAGAKKTAKTPKASGGAKKKAPTSAKPKRVSALDAAVQILAKATEPMKAKELIAAMAEQGLWSSPNGKTPHATLYAAMLREITAKGSKARFCKVDRGQFAVNKEGQ